MNCWPVLDSWYCEPASKNALRSPSNSETWVCIAEPGCWVNGLGMNVAQMPWLSATSRMTVRKVMMLSAVRQRVGVPQVDLLLARPALVVAELHRDAHRLEHRDRLAAEVGAHRLRGVVEVPAAVDRHRLDAGLRVVLEQVELDLGVRVEREPLVGRLGQGALEDVARVGVRRASRRASRCRRTSAPCSAPRRATAGSGTSTGRAWRACRTRRPGRTPRSPTRRTRSPRRRPPRARPARPPRT